MARGIWKGNISFGLINIPVEVMTAEKSSHSGGLDFNLIDRRDHNHVGYQKINKHTGKVIDSKNIVKGLKLESGEYTIFEPQELAKLRIKGNNSIDIQQFVSRDEVDPRYFEKPYYLVPGKGAGKAYALLREALKKTDKYGVGLVVMHTKQHLVLIGDSGPAMLLEVVRYYQEIKEVSELELDAVSKQKISSKELSMAEKLVSELTEKWKPQIYKDTYRQQVMAAVKKKPKDTIADKSKDAPEASNGKAHSQVMDLLPLLEKSLKSKGSRQRSARKKSDKSVWH